jgi:hypothetical protein
VASHFGCLRCAFSELCRNSDRAGQSIVRRFIAVRINLCAATILSIEISQVTSTSSSSSRSVRSDICLCSALSALLISAEFTHSSGGGGNSIQFSSSSISHFNAKVHTKKKNRGWKARAVFTCMSRAHTTAAAATRERENDNNLLIRSVKN